MAVDSKYECTARLERCERLRPDFDIFISRTITTFSGSEDTVDVDLDILIVIDKQTKLGDIDGCG